MEFLDRADDQGAIRTGASEERHVVTRAGHDVLTSYQLATAVGGDSRLESSRDQRNCVAFRRVEPRAGRIDSYHAAPDAGRSSIALRPAFLTAAERIERATSHDEQARDEQKEADLRHVLILAHIAAGTSALTSPMARIRRRAAGADA